MGMTFLLYDKKVAAGHRSLHYDEKVAAGHRSLRYDEFTPNLYLAYTATQASRLL